MKQRNKKSEGKVRTEKKGCESERIPTVRIVKVKGRQLQLRYIDRVTLREVRITTGTDDMKQAELEKRRLEGRLSIGANPRPRKSERGPHMPWQDFREEYRNSYLPRLRSKSAVDAESRLDIAEKILKPRILADMIDPDALERLKDELSDGAAGTSNRRRSLHTVRSYMAAIVAALRWAKLKRWIDSVPDIEKVDVSKSKWMKGRPLIESEFHKMLEAVPLVVGVSAAPSWARFLRGLWESGLRLRELMNVSWDLPNSIFPIRTEGVFTSLAIPADMQKNKTDVAIPLLPGFEKVLLETPEPLRTGWIFRPSPLHGVDGVTTGSGRLTPEWVGKVISRIGRKAGIVVEPPDPANGRPCKFASAHDLRRSLAQRLRLAGVPPLMISQVMRHASWDTTARHYAPGDTIRESKKLREILSLEQPGKPADSGD